MVAAEAAVRAAQTTEAGAFDRGVPSQPWRPEESFVDDRGVREGLVADGGEPCGSRSHAASLVHGSRSGVPRRPVRRVTTLKETAGYGEYVRWCGRTGAARPPPTRSPAVLCAPGAGRIRRSAGVNPAARSTPRRLALVRNAGEQLPKRFRYYRRRCMPKRRDRPPIGATRCTTRCMMTHRRWSLLEVQNRVEQLNRMMLGWA